MIGRVLEIVFALAVGLAVVTSVGIWAYGQYKRIKDEYK